MAISLAQTSTVTNFALSTKATTLASTTTAGSAIIIAIINDSNMADNMTVTDNNGNIYTKLFEQVSLAPSFDVLSLWVTGNISGRAGHVVTIGNANLWNAMAYIRE